MHYIPVTCAAISLEGKILAVQRSPKMDQAGFWEFPGGKIEQGKAAEDCIIREIKEELDL